ncbi:GNAT family N-acetyltransferase [Undibacterium parvum]|uniref:GNAT family N-acetyltransferase n=2 Tax=Undibacterium TaxID=401469 RepID=A0A6M4AD29_9BURK|nr:GNAT family N-acetyltransferase [Undibacterium parvum]AZP14158.1 GNAT family N-acetyltransferase [Undibacterium parvum]QJQ07579.1 GNAT family N-acetyltransferase [Undibacterium piscinae]
MNQKLQVRAVCQDDYPEWKILWDGYNAFYGRHGETALAPELTQMAWSRFFENNEPVHALVAVEAGQIVGLAHYLFHRNIRKFAPDCYLQDLFTAETARGKGVGRALILAVAQQATQAGSDLYWHTHLENTRARALYDQVARHSGFIVYSKTKG